MRQLSLIKKEPTEHGGDIKKGRRKGPRPFSPRASMHIVMRSHRAWGRWSLLHHRNRANVKRLVYTWADKKGVKIYRFANVGNHVHLLVKAPSKPQLQQFLKTFAGLIARAVTGAQKGIKTGRFWEKTAYSNLVPSGTFKSLWAYFDKNRFEAIGFGGARLRIRANGTAIIVVGDPGEDHEQAERIIRGTGRSRPSPITYSAVTYPE